MTNDFFGSDTKDIVYRGNKAYRQAPDGTLTREPSKDLPDESAGAAAPKPQGAVTRAQLEAAGAKEARPGTWIFTNADGSVSEYRQNVDGTFDEYLTYTLKDQSERCFSNKPCLGW